MCCNNFIKLLFQKVPFETFQCTKDSPRNPVWSSNTTPSVALTHIFCGEITRAGAAQGLHSLPGGNDPTSAKTAMPCAAYKGLECRSTVEIYDSASINFVPKTPQIANALFFACTIKDTVDYLIALYQSPNCRTVIKNGKVCVRDNTKGIAVALVIVNGADILTAYPFRVENFPPANCDAKCEYQ